MGLNQTSDQGAVISATWSAAWPAGARMPEHVERLAWGAWPVTAALGTELGSSPVRTRRPSGPVLRCHFSVDEGLREHVALIAMFLRDTWANHEVLRLVACDRHVSVLFPLYRYDAAREVLLPAWFLRRLGRLGIRLQVMACKTSDPE